MSSHEHDRKGRSDAPHLRVIDGGEPDEEILETGFTVIGDDDADPWQRAGGEAPPPGARKKAKSLADAEDDEEDEEAAARRRDATRPEVPMPRGRRKPRRAATGPDDPTPPPPAGRSASRKRRPDAGLPPAQLRILEGPGAGLLLPLPSKAVIGRSSECEITVRDLSISRRHAEVRRTGARSFEVRDLDSRNGTGVDGEPARIWTEAGPGSVVAVGDVRLRIEIEDFADPTLERPGISPPPPDPTPPPAPDPTPPPAARRPPTPRPDRPLPPPPPAPPGVYGSAPPSSRPAPGLADRVPLGPVAKGALAVGIGAGATVLAAWLLFFASFAPFGSHGAPQPSPQAMRPLAPGTAPTHAAPGATGPAHPARPATKPAARAALSPAEERAKEALDTATDAYKRHDWIVAVHEASAVPTLSVRHAEAAQLLRRVRKRVLSPGLAKARHELRRHRFDAAETRLLGLLQIWPDEPQAKRLLDQDRAARQAATAPPAPTRHHTSHRSHARSHRHSRHSRHARHTAPPAPAPVADNGLLKTARKAFAQKRLHSARAAAESAADLGTRGASALAKDIEAFEKAWNTATHTRSIATALGSYTEALYRARRIDPPSGGAYGRAAKKALGRAHYVAALQAQKAGRNQDAASHARKALHYDPTLRGARSLLRALGR